MTNINNLPSTPTVDTFIDLALLYHENQLTTNDLSIIKAKYPIGTTITMNGVEYWLADYEEGKSDSGYPGIDQKDVPLFVFITTKSFNNIFEMAEVA